MTEPAMDSCDPDELEAKVAKARRILRDSGNLLKKGSDHIAQLGFGYWQFGKMAKRYAASKKFLGLFGHKSADS